MQAQQERRRPLRAISTIWHLLDQHGRGRIDDLNALQRIRDTAAGAAGQIMDKERRSQDDEGARP